MLNETLTHYLASLTTRGVSTATWRAACSDLTIFCRWWETKHAQLFDVASVVDRDNRERKQARQCDFGAASATINRGLSTLRRFCAWAVTQRLLPENPAMGIEDVLSEPLSPRSLPDQAVDALLRAARNSPNIRLRLRDEAMLSLLIYVGLRVQEVCDVQLRDVDLASGTIIVRSGKGGKARRVPLHPDAGRMLERYLTEVRCPDGIPPLGSVEERESLLVGMQITVARRPFSPGIKTRMILQRVAALGRQSVAQLREIAKRERNLDRAEQLRTHAQLLEAISPHMLRRSLARRMLKNGVQLPEVQRVMGHMRLSTTGIYLTPSEDDLRTAIGRSGI